MVVTATDLHTLAPVNATSPKKNPTVAIEARDAVDLDAEAGDGP
jgi:hypothetical protein